MDRIITDESTIQNLKDAGCDAEMIQSFMEDLHAGKESEGLRLLAMHRRKLLELLHRDQRCIDCLDYLVYQMKKNKKY